MPSKCILKEAAEHLHDSSNEKVCKYGAYPVTKLVGSLLSSIIDVIAQLKHLPWKRSECNGVQLCSVHFCHVAILV